MSAGQKIVLVLGVVVLATLFLSGCSSLRYAECIARDNTSNPCNW